MQNIPIRAQDSTRQEIRGKLTRTFQHTLCSHNCLPCQKPIPCRAQFSSEKCQKIELEEKIPEKSVKKVKDAEELPGKWIQIYAVRHVRWPHLQVLISLII